MIELENLNNDNVESSIFVVIMPTEDNQTLTINRDGTDIYTATLNLDERANIKKLSSDTITIDNALVIGTNSIGEFTTIRAVKDGIIRADQI